MRLPAAERIDRSGPHLVRASLLTAVTAVARSWPATLRRGFAGAVLLTFVPMVFGGCANAAAHSDAGRPVAAASVVVSPASPAASAGGACFLLDYGTIRQVTGVAFDVAASSQSGVTFTCVLERHSGNFPDLTLAVTPTDADPGVFGSTVQPKGASPVAGLGRAGYSAVLPAAAGAGPAVEVGWLSANGRLLVLRYRGAAATAGQIGAVAPKFTDLARKIDQDSQD